jgi:hypothetical protein
MRTFCFIIISLLIFTACQRQEVKAPEAAPDNAPMIIDYPAGVMISSKSQVSAPANHNISIAEKILSPHRIPVLDTNTRELVFVKTNGDRITVTMQELAGKYDIILFNAINNPVPLRLADLQGAFGKIFNLQSENITSEPVHAEVKEIHSTSIDTSSKKTIRERLSALNSRDKRVILTTADTSAKEFAERIIPGVQWVQHRVDTRSILRINFENDLITYANTDRYFTNGVAFELQAAWLGRSAVMNKLMIPYRHSAFITYNLSMVQDMYTPTDTRVAPALNHDRPYSSYLYFSFGKTTADPVRKLKMASQLDAGYIGPYSPGSYMQTLVHNTFPTNDVPLGWETQINTDVILNYSYNIQKALVNNQNFSLLAGAEIEAGTLYNNAGVKMEMQAGKFEPVFGITADEQWPKLQYYFFAKMHTGYVAYNALLQGGMFNRNNIFTLKGNEIQRVVGGAEAGLHFSYKGTGIEVAQHYLSPEYKGGFWHKWGRLSLLFKL